MYASQLMSSFVCQPTNPIILCQHTNPIICMLANKRQHLIASKPIPSFVYHLNNHIFFMSVILTHLLYATQIIPSFVCHPIIICVPAKQCHYFYASQTIIWFICQSTNLIFFPANLSPHLYASQTIQLFVYHPIILIICLSANK